ETQPKEYVWAKTGSGKNAVEDGASLFITPQKPTVIDNWPKCHLACVNAEIGAEFSLPMDLASLATVKLFKCGSGVLGVETPDCNTPAIYNLTPVSLDENNTKFSFNLLTGTNLEKNMAFWVTIPSSVKSAGGSQMEKDFGWDFTTKDDNTLCDIDKVVITPDVATVYVKGDKAQYYSHAFGTADECNKNGQKLLSWAYNWKWSSVPPDTVASITNWDKSVSGSKIGCNSLCQHIGSQPKDAVIGLCGDNKVDEGEDCNAPEKNEATCTLNCLFPKEKKNTGTDQCSSQKSFNCCGNGAKEVGEDCDKGKENNGQSASGCSNSCLKIGTPISVNKCKEIGFTLDECLQKGAISVCGNSGNPEPGEDCDLGNDNGKDGQICTASCLTVGKKMIENPLCGNGLVELGEDMDCDTGGGDEKVDPLQWATAVGNGLVDAQKQMTATIVAGTKNKAGTDKAGTAKFILQCGFSPVDADCPVDKMAAYFGIGKNSCCYPRPTVGLIQPPVQNSVCPNTAITLKFSEEMNVGTFSSSTILGYFNIILAEATSTLSSCPSGTWQVAQETKYPQGWWNKIIAWFKHLIGQSAEAKIYCAGGVDYTLVSTTINEGTKGSPMLKTQVSLDLKNPLAYKTDYEIIVTKDVKSAAGVSLKTPYSQGFITKEKLCQIDNIKIDPEAWWFNTIKDEVVDNTPGIAEFDTKNDVDKMFSPHAYYVNKAVHGSPPQEELDSVDGYSWTYNWTIGDNSIVEKGFNLIKEAQEFKAKGKNGVTQVGAAATIDASSVIDKGSQYSATSTVQVFICENPWPAIPATGFDMTYGLGYVDAINNTNGIGPGKGWTNFKLMYCRDAGAPNDISDDLSALNSPTVLPHPNPAAPAPADPVFKEFFSSFAPSSAGVTNKNSIGLRVYSNINHLSLAKWYQADPAEAPGSPPAKGAPTPAQVGSYKALQEGRTYYVDGINSSGTNLFSNVYVFSFSDNPTAETLNIVNQLLSNFTLNVNVDDKEIVAKMYRDYQRLQDLKLISDELWSYYGEKGEYPKLTENPQLGTYLPSYTNSKWKSWQGVLGNLVKYTLPVDPLNGFYGCSSSTLNVGTPLPGVNLGPFDAETCWNATNSTFVCPLGSQVYQYETKGGADAWLKADFELPAAYIWYKSLSEIKPVGQMLGTNCSYDKKSCQSQADCAAFVDNCGTSWHCDNKVQACSKDSDCGTGSCIGTKACNISKKTCQTNADCTISNNCGGALSFQSEKSCEDLVKGESGKCGDGIVGTGEICEIGAQQYAPCIKIDLLNTVWDESKYPAKECKSAAPLALDGKMQVRVFCKVHAATG
ncbi:MAG: Ig-like domain-containing protein, partial [Patescibacteria group bacterium]